MWDHSTLNLVSIHGSKVAAAPLNVEDSCSSDLGTWLGGGKFKYIKNGTTWSDANFGDFPHPLRQLQRKENSGETGSSIKFDASRFNLKH